MIGSGTGSIIVPTYCEYDELVAPTLIYGISLTQEQAGKHMLSY